MITVGSLFDGIGGWQLAANHCGAVTIWSSEIEAFPRHVTSIHFPNTEQLGDINKIDGAAIKPVDIICAGSPCQDLSIAGKREGLDGKRSSLFYQAMRIVREMRDKTNGKYPKFFIWENVTGAFTSNNGRDFQSVLKEIGQTDISIPGSGRWAKSGMVRSKECNIAWRTLDAQFWGVPQRRKRIFLVAGFGKIGGAVNEILFKPESMQGDFEKSKSEEQSSSENLRNRTDSANQTMIYDVRITSEGTRNARANVYNTDICRTLDTKPQNPAGNQGGIAIVSFKNASNLLSETSRNDEPVVIPCAFQSYSEAKISEIGTTLKASSGSLGGGSENIAIQKTWSVSGSQGDRIAIDANKSFTLSANGGGAGAKTGLYMLKDDDRYIVRRLTPKECERLQGLPDNYTDFGSDTARYKAIGNGMAQPCADFVMRRVVEVLRYDKKQDERAVLV